MADDEDEKEDNRRGGQCHTNSSECTIFNATLMATLMKT